MPFVQPFNLVHPRITLDAGAATPVDIECNANEVHHNVAQDESTVDTFCGSSTTYKPPVHDLTIQVVQSFGTDGLWTKVKPLCGTTVPFELLPDGDAVVSIDNPLMEGTALVKELQFIDAAVGEATEVDLVLSIQGDPTYTTTPGATGFAAASSAPKADAHA